MKPDFTPDTLRELLKNRNLKHKDLQHILGTPKEPVLQQTVSHIMRGNRKLSPSDQKVLKLYFFDEHPFKGQPSRKRLIAPQ